MVGFGTALAGYGLAQPDIRAQDAARQKQAMLAMLGQSLQGGGAPPMPQPVPIGAMPAGQSPIPQPMPGGASSVTPRTQAPPVVQSPVSGLPGSTPTGLPPQQGGMPGLPDFSQVMAKISSMPGSAADKGAAIMQLLPEYTKLWTAQNESNYRNQELTLAKLREKTAQDRENTYERSEAERERYDRTKEDRPKKEVSSVSKNDVVKSYQDWQADPTNKQKEDAYNAKREAFNSAKAKPAAKPSADVTPEPTFDSNVIIQQAREAIKAGAPKDAVAKRLKDQGIAPPDDL